MKCYIHCHGTRGHDVVWKSYARKVNKKYPCYHISTYGDLDADRERNGMPKTQFNELMGYKYKIICDGCGSCWYRQRMSKSAIEGHKNGEYFCAKCNSHNFTIEEI